MATLLEFKRVLFLSNQEILNAFTLDSPISFKIEDIIQQLEFLNQQMIPGKTKEVQGPFYGQFSRLLLRLKSKTTDRRYSFLFGGKKSTQDYNYLSALAEKLMGFGKQKQSIKVIDFSEVPRSEERRVGKEGRTRWSTGE